MSNGTNSWTDLANTSSYTGDVVPKDSGHDIGFTKFEFFQTNPWLAFPIVLVLFVASLIGTVGNILILLSVLMCKNVRTVESTFIVNLALSDLYVTLIADPFSIIGK